MKPRTDPLEHLTETEQSCVRKFLELLSAQLGENLSAVYLFGSFARGDMWAERHTLHSDIDLLVLTFQPLRSSLQEAPINETYPLYLECGRQLSPLWRTVAFWENPPDDRVREIKARIEADMRLLPFSE